MNMKRHKQSIAVNDNQPAVAHVKGKYPSIEAASLAKMESAKEFIANIDMTLFKKNGHIE